MTTPQLSEAELKSNAAEYLQWRSSKLGASEVPAVMGVSPYQTPYGLWLVKTGKTSNRFYTNYAIEIGKKFEDTARARYEMITEANFPPTIVVSSRHPWMHASLDGLNKENNIVLEIKCVSGDKVYHQALEGVVAGHYRDQVLQQLYCADAKEAHFYVCKVESKYGVPQIVGHALVIEKQDKERQEQIVDKCIEFWSMVQSNTPPPMGERDELELTDEKSIEVFSGFLKEDLTDKAKKIIKAEAIKLAEQHHTYVSCVGVKLKKTNGVWRVTKDLHP